MEWGAHHSHRFAHDEDERLLCDHNRVCEEKESEGDVEEGERSNDRGARYYPHDNDMVVMVDRFEEG